MSVDFGEAELDFKTKFPKKTNPDRPDNKFDLLCAAHKLFTNGDIDLDKYKSVFTYIAEKERGTVKMVEKVKAGDESDIAEAYEKLSYQLLCDDVVKPELKNDCSTTGCSIRDVFS